MGGSGGIAAGARLPSRGHGSATGGLGPGGLLGEPPHRQPCVPHRLGRSLLLLSLAAVLLSMNERAFYDASLGRGSAAQDRDLVETLATVWMRAVYGGDAPGGV